MFDISFGEILIVAIVALVVIGPEKLPKVARTLGLLAGRMQRYVSAVKGDIERELKADELRQIQRDLTHQVSAVETQVSDEVRRVSQSADALAEDVVSEPRQDSKPGS